jgi:hypothetical protein
MPISNPFGDEEISDEDPFAVGDESERFANQQMQGFMRSPSTGFAGVTDPKKMLEPQPEPPSSTSPEHFIAQAESAPKGSPERERALNMAVRMSEPGAAKTALELTSALPMVPIGKAAAIRGLYGLAGTAGGATVGNLLGRGLEYMPGVPDWTSDVTAAIGGLVGGGAAAIKGQKGLQTVADLSSPESTAGRVLRFLSRFNKDKGATSAEQIAQEVAAARTTAAAGRAVSSPAAKAVLSEEEQLTRDIMRGVNGFPVERQKAQQMARDILSGGKSAAPATKTASQIARETAGARRVSDISKVVPIRPPAKIDETILKIQQMISDPSQRKAVQAWLAHQPPEVVAQIEPLLERGISTMPQTYAGLTRSAPSPLQPKIPNDYGAELAKLLGQ